MIRNTARVNLFLQPETPLKETGKMEITKDKGYTPFFMVIDLRVVISWVKDLERVL